MQFRRDQNSALISLTAAQRRAEDAGLADLPEVKAALATAYQRLVDVMEEKVDYKAAVPVIKAALALCDAVAGRQVERQEIRGAVTLAAMVQASLAPAVGAEAPVLPVPLTPPAHALPPASMGAGEDVALPVRRKAAAAPEVRRKGGVGGGALLSRAGPGGAGAKTGRGAPGGWEEVPRKSSNIEDLLGPPPPLRHAAPPPTPSSSQDSRPPTPAPPSSIGAPRPTSPTEK